MSMFDWANDARWRLFSTGTKRNKAQTLTDTFSLSLSYKIKYCIYLLSYYLNV